MSSMLINAVNELLMMIWGKFQALGELFPK